MIDRLTITNLLSVAGGCGQVWTRRSSGRQQSNHKFTTKRVYYGLLDLVKLEDW
jgi:hypothetical protein